MATIFYHFVRLFSLISLRLSRPCEQNVDHDRPKNMCTHTILRSTFSARGRVLYCRLLAKKTTPATIIRRDSWSFKWALRSLITISALSCVLTSCVLRHASDIRISFGPIHSAEPLIRKIKRSRHFFNSLRRSMGFQVHAKDFLGDRKIFECIWLILK